jgi:hypothetical protein
LDAQPSPSTNVWVVLRNNGANPTTVDLNALVMQPDGTSRTGILSVCHPDESGPQMCAVDLNQPDKPIAIKLAGSETSDPLRITLTRTAELPSGAKTYLMASVPGSNGVDVKAALLPLTLQPALRSDLPPVRASWVLALSVLGAIVAIGCVFAITGLGRALLSNKVYGLAKWDRGSWVSTLTAVGAALGGIFNLSGALANDPQILSKADYAGLNFTFLALAAVGAAVYGMTTQEEASGSGNYFRPLGWFLFSTAFALCAAAGTLLTAGLYLVEVALQGNLDAVTVAALVGIWIFGAGFGAAYAIRSVAKLVTVQVTPPEGLPVKAAGARNVAPPHAGKPLTLKPRAAHWRDTQGGPSPSFSAI